MTCVYLRNCRFDLAALHTAIMNLLRKQHSLARLGVLLATCGVLTAYSASAQENPRLVAFEMRPGDTLWDIARNHLDLPTRWQDVMDVNGISKPGDLTVGEPVRIDESWFQISAMELEVTEIVGVVEITRDGETSLLAKGLLDDPGQTIIQSHDESRTKLTFDNGCTIILAPGSVLVLDRVRYLGNGLIPDIAVTLESGNAEVAYPKVDINRGRLNIKTRAAITSVRGTEFRVAFDAESGRAKGESLSGLVAFGADEQIVELPANFGSVAPVGEPPLAPVRLLDPPLIQALPQVITKVPRQFTVQAVDGAAAYNFEWYPQGQPLSPISVQRPSGPVIETGDLDDGEYVLLARSIDGNGLEGPDTSHLVEIDARPRQPTIESPVQQGRLLEARPELAWAIAEDDVTFTLELASNGDFSEPFHVVGNLRANRYVLPIDLTPGTYGWRVSATDATGDTGQPSETGSFRYAPPLPAVQPELVYDLNERLVAKWTPLAQATSYQIELAADPEFEQVFRRKVSDKPEIDLGKPLPGPNWVRVVAFDSDNIPGATSAAVSFQPEPPPFWEAIGIPAGLAFILILLL